MMSLGQFYTVHGIEGDIVYYYVFSGGHLTKRGDNRPSLGTFCTSVKCHPR